MSVKLLFNDLPQYHDGDGAPYAGALLFTYASGSSTKQTTYQDSAGGTAHSNPIVLDSNGRMPAAVWGTVGQTFKLVLAPSDDTDPPTSPIWSIDDVSPINDASVTLDQWSSSGLTPTYISATQFSVPGDQTSVLHVGRRLKLTDAGGTKYGYITVAAYTTLTTVTVVLDSGSLSSPVSAVDISIQTADNPSDALLTDAHPIRSGSADKTKKVRLEVDGITSGATRVLTVADGNFTLGDGFTTGDVKLTLKTTADSGWVLMDDKTIGDASSAATGRANADTESLFTLLWNNTADADCAVSTGRGATAAADFAAHKTIALPKTLGRALAVYGSGSGLTARALAHVVGTETHALTQAQLPDYTLPTNGITGIVGAGAVGLAGGASAAAVVSVTSGGSDEAHPNMQPTVFLNVMIKL